MRPKVKVKKSTRGTERKAKRLGFEGRGAGNNMIFFFCVWESVNRCLVCSGEQKGSLRAGRERGMGMDGEQDGGEELR
jgi:hypothetical protein